MFGVVGQVLVKPHLLRDVDEEYHAFYLEEASVNRKLENAEKMGRSTKQQPEQSSQTSHYTDIRAIPTKFVSLAESFLNQRRNSKIKTNHHLIYNELEIEKLKERLRELKSERKELDKLRSSSPLQRNLMYPLAMLSLLIITGLTVLIVVHNTLELLIGIKALPLSTRVCLFIAFVLVM